MHGGELRIVKACEANLPLINALIARSKAHWIWPGGYLERALPLLAITPEYLRDSHSFEGWEGERLVAFVSLLTTLAGARLNDLWVEPERIGMGIGSRMWTHVAELARTLGWREVSVLPDPPSEGFYLAKGFSDTGERIPSRVPSGPAFAVFRIDIGGS